MSGPLAGRVALVTGVSRRAGIGFAIARRLLADGASVLVHSWSVHDAEQPWGADPGGIDAVLAGLGGLGERLAHVAADFTDPEVPAAVVDAVVGTFGGLDIVVANHARSSHHGLGDLSAEELDRCWAVNVRSTLLLVQEWAARRPAEHPGGRLVLFTSGQHIGPMSAMSAELPYAVTKAAVHQMTSLLANALIDRGITVNCVNPGPTDTGWAGPEQTEAVQAMMPAGRWGQPDDAARLVAWLVSDEARWITSQVIDSEGGFRRWAR